MSEEVREGGRKGGRERERERRGKREGGTTRGEGQRRRKETMKILSVLSVNMRLIVPQFIVQSHTVTIIEGSVINT